MVLLGTFARYVRRISVRPQPTYSDRKREECLARLRGGKANSSCGRHSAKSNGKSPRQSTCRPSGRNEARQRRSVDSNPEQRFGIKEETGPMAAPRHLCVPPKATAVGKWTSPSCWRPSRSTPRQKSAATARIYDTPATGDGVAFTPEDPEARSTASASTLHHTTPETPAAPQVCGIVASWPST